MMCLSCDLSQFLVDRSGLYRKLRQILGKLERSFQYDFHMVGAELVVFHRVVCVISTPTVYFQGTSVYTEIIYKASAVFHLRTFLLPGRALPIYLLNLVRQQRASRHLLRNRQSLSHVRNQS
jgi:hypothetical protein